MARQLTFDLPVKSSRDRGDFFVSEANAPAVERLDDTAGWTLGKLALTGPEGSGKSHLAHVWAEAGGGNVLALADLPGRNVAHVRTPVAVEIPDVAAFSPAEEEALFHLHNHLAGAGLAFLLVARTPPARWPVALPDLKSRIEATDIVSIDRPDDALLAAVLVKLFTDRQLQVPPTLITWLTLRMDRSFAEAQRLVAVLDQTALSEGRAVSQRLAQEVLDKLHASAR